MANRIENEEKGKNFKICWQIRLKISGKPEKTSRDNLQDRIPK